MKNKDCKIVQDLFPNYIENLTSDETNNFIETHVEGCNDCKELLETMRKDLKENSEVNLNIKEVKYAKKILAKLNLLKVFIILVIIAVLIFIGSNVRKYVILRKLYTVNYVNENSTNYRLTTYSYLGLSDTDIREYNQLGKKFISYSTSYNIKAKDGNISESIVYKDNEEMLSLWDDEAWIRKLSPEEKNEEDIPFTMKYYQDNIYNSLDFFDLKFILKSKIKEEIFDGNECIVISFKLDGNDTVYTFYFEKYTGLLRKTTEQNWSQEYYWEFNCINENMLKRPDTSGMKIVEEKEANY